MFRHSNPMHSAHPRRQVRFTPCLEKLEKITLLSLTVGADMNPHPYNFVSSSIDGAIRVTAQGLVGNAEADASGMTLDVNTYDGDGLSSAAGGTATGAWSFSVVGVPAGTEVPLDFTYKTSGFILSTSLSSKFGISLASGGYDFYLGSTKQSASETIESESGAIIYQQSSGELSGLHDYSQTVSGNGIIHADIRGSSAGTVGSTTTEGNMSLQLVGISTPLAATYPNVALQFDDGLTMSANPFIVPQGQFTFDVEGNDNPDSDGFSRDISHPSDSSGVTIGRGYDMSQQNPNQIYNDMINADISSAIASILSQAAGLTGVDADNFIAKYHDSVGTITPEQQYLLFNNTYASYEQSMEKTYARSNLGQDVPSWGLLPQNVRDVLVDIAYQNGKYSLLDPNAAQAAAQGGAEGLITYIESVPTLVNQGRGRVAYLE